MDFAHHLTNNKYLVVSETSPYDFDIEVSAGAELVFTLIWTPFPYKDRPSHV